MIELIVVVRIHDLNFLGLLRLDTDVTLNTLYSVLCRAKPHNFTYFI